MGRWILLTLTLFSSLYSDEFQDIDFQPDTNCETCKPPAGKIDIAPSFLKVNIVESGKTIDTHHMRGVRGGLDYFIWKALLFRGTALAAWGDAEFQTYTAGLGACLPYKKFYFTPTVGVTYSRYKTKFDYLPFSLYNLTQRFESLGPYTGLDIQWCITNRFRVGAGVQYSWSRTSTKIKPILPKTKGHSKGPTWSVLLERDITKKLSVNIGAAYNRSLSHEKHGIKGQGIKVGLTYWL